MTASKRPWVGPVLVLLGLLALLGGAGFLQVLVVMTGLWWLLTRTGSGGRRRAPGATSPPAPQRRTPPDADTAYWPVLPAAAGAAAAWYATRDNDADVTAQGDETEDGEGNYEIDGATAGGWSEPVDEMQTTSAPDAWDGNGGGGSWADDFGGSGGGGDWADGDDTGDGSWGDGGGFGSYGGGGGWDDD